MGFGGKRVLLAAIVVFTTASALYGLASGLGEPVAFRILQGAGGGSSLRSEWRCRTGRSRRPSGSGPRPCSPSPPRSPVPMVNLRVRGNRLFRAGNGVMILASVAFLGTLYTIWPYYQDGRG